MNTWLGIDWGAVSALATCAGTIAVIAASIFALRQLNEMKRAREAQNLQGIWNMLNTLDARKDRRALIQGGQNYVSMLLEDKSCEDELLRVESVCATWDCVAFLCKEGLLDCDKVAKHWCTSIINCWDPALPMITKYRKERRRDAWASFEWLVLLAQDKKMEIDKTKK